MRDSSIARNITSHKMSSKTLTSHNLTSQSCQEKHDVTCSWCASCSRKSLNCYGHVKSRRSEQVESRPGKECDSSGLCKSRCKPCSLDCVTCSTERRNDCRRLYRCASDRVHVRLNKRLRTYFLLLLSSCTFLSGAFGASIPSQANLMETFNTVDLNSSFTTTAYTVLPSSMSTWNTIHSFDDNRLGRSELLTSDIHDLMTAESDRYLEPTTDTGEVVTVVTDGIINKEKGEYRKDSDGSTGLFNSLLSYFGISHYNTTSTETDAEKNEGPLSKDLATTEDYRLFELESNALTSSDNFSAAISLQARKEAVNLKNDSSRILFEWLNEDHTASSEDYQKTFTDNTSAVDVSISKSSEITLQASPSELKNVLQNDDRELQSQYRESNQAIVEDIGTYSKGAIVKKLFKLDAIATSEDLLTVSNSDDIIIDHSNTQARLSSTDNHTSDCTQSGESFADKENSNKDIVHKVKPLQAEEIIITADLQGEQQQQVIESTSVKDICDAATVGNAKLNDDFDVKDEKKLTEDVENGQSGRRTSTMTPTTRQTRNDASPAVRRKEKARNSKVDVQRRRQRNERRLATMRKHRGSTIKPTTPVSVTTPSLRHSTDDASVRLLPNGCSEDWVIAQYMLDTTGMPRDLPSVCHKRTLAISRRVSNCTTGPDWFCSTSFQFSISSFYPTPTTHQNFTSTTLVIPLQVLHTAPSPQHPPRLHLSAAVRLFGHMLPLLSSSLDQPSSGRRTGESKTGAKKSSGGVCLIGDGLQGVIAQDLGDKAQIRNEHKGHEALKRDDWSNAADSLTVDVSIKLIAGRGRDRIARQGSVIGYSIRIDPPILIADSVLLGDDCQTKMWKLNDKT